MKVSSPGSWSWLDRRRRRWLHGPGLGGWCRAGEARGCSAGRGDDLRRDGSPLVLPRNNSHLAGVRAHSLSVSVSWLVSLASLSSSSPCSLSCHLQSDQAGLTPSLSALQDCLNTTEHKSHPQGGNSQPAPPDPARLSSPARPPDWLAAVNTGADWSAGGPSQHDSPGQACWLLSAEREDRGDTETVLTILGQGGGEDSRAA